MNALIHAQSKTIGLEPLFSGSLMFRGNKSIIPGQRADAVALLHAETLQGQRHALDAWMSVGIGVAMDVALDLARDDLCLAVMVCGILDQAADQERHVHHQSLHHFLRIAMSLHGACDLRARLPERHAPFTQKRQT
ncbi:hypothetical protein ABIF37_008131 [Bradyrhizobium diazoefficiens]